ncbi:MAG: glycosyltransferase [Propionibacteriaceae bacterium]|jgi:GT2 family glycosyltransferase|nr:glycosyltransferase [Propionibacteriaceae bacterium]
MSIDRLAQVIVTYNRPDLLRELLDSIARVEPKPWRVIVVDNASTDGLTPGILEEAAQTLPDGLLQVHHSPTNTGGSGGFSTGVDLAVKAGAKWIWLMDDDVEVLPGALDKLEPWTERFQLIQARRLDVNGQPFYWQARFNEFLGVPMPYSLNNFNGEGYVTINSGTFEGMLIAVDLVMRIGLPDPRFFISWDDAVYAWVASQYATCVYVDAFVLQKKRDQKQISLGFRHFNDSPQLSKFYTMRNRGYVWRYFKEYGALNRFGFGLGTFLTFGKELLRLVAVEHSLKGLKPLLRGIWAAGKLRHDRQWRPMPPLADAQPSSAATNNQTK